jgi:hypothetical protein
MLTGVHLDAAIDLVDILGRCRQWQGYSEARARDKKTHETTPDRVTTFDATKSPIRLS